MAESLANKKKQQGTLIVTHAHITSSWSAYFYSRSLQVVLLELQLQYTTYKNQLQQLAQKIGDIEQEAEEHKYVRVIIFHSHQFSSHPYFSFFLSPLDK